MTQIYTPKEVAEILKITYGHCLKLIRDGDLKAKRIGNKYRITKKDIDTFIDTDEFDLEDILVFKDHKKAMEFMEDFYNQNPEIDYLNINMTDDNFKTMKIAIPRGAKYAKK